MFNSTISQISYNGTTNFPFFPDDNSNATPTRLRHLSPYLFLSREGLQAVVLVHDRVGADVGRKVALDALLPAGDLECARVAPRLERELALDRAREARGPLEARECGDGGLDERRAQQVRAQADVVCVQKSDVCAGRGERGGDREGDAPMIVASCRTCPTAVMFPPLTKMSW